MKNIHVLPTDKPSTLSTLRYNLSNVFVLTKGYYNDYDKKDNQHIFITTDEEIKEGYVLNTFNNTVYKIVPDNSSRELLSNPTILPLCAINREHYFKIILTTDQDLIADGVQAIDDKFLEWFVYNPSCEFADVNDWLDDNGNIAFGGDKRYQLCNHLYNKQIILKEEPQQETLEEAAEEYNSIKIARESFTAGAKWQAERMYSEEEVKEIILDAINSCTDGMSSHNQDFKEWFEENKKKV